MEHFQNQETRCGREDAPERLKAVLLDLAKELQRVCEKYHLRYFLHAGTLLGAVRHGGFIPWDDDMDFAFPRAEYQKLLQVAEREFQYPYHLQTPENTITIFNNGRTMLRKSDTTGVQRIKDLYSKENQGIGIDIVILDDSYSDPYLRKKQLKALDLYIGLLYTKTYGNLPNVLKKSKPGKLYDLLSYAVAKAIPRKYLIQRINGGNLIASVSRRHTPDAYIATSESFGPYRHLLLKKEWYESAEYVCFEGCKFPLPQGYDGILKIYYGENYLAYPEPDKRKGHHYPVVSVDESYSVYLKRFHDIFCDTSQKTIVIFGAGNMLLHYLDNVEKKYWPEFVVDSDKQKWGSLIRGIKVEPVEKLSALPKDALHIIICSIYYKDIAKRLAQMNIKNYYIYVQNKKWL